MSQTILWFLVWGAVIFFMMRFGCGAHVMGHHGHRGHGDSRPEGQSPQQAVDPVCGMTVAPREAKTAVHAGRVYCFCSPDCREKFEASPASYTPEARAQIEEHHHG